MWTWFLFAMITSGEIRAARAYLNWTRQKLADMTRLSLNSITRLERDEVDARSETVMAVRRAFEKHGIEFLSLVEGKEGIRIRQMGSRQSKR